MKQPSSIPFSAAPRAWRSPSSRAGLPTSLVLLLAAVAGLAAASLYYNQPMLALLAADLGTSGQTVGLVPTLTQAGYAIGILLLAPLGDRFDRRRIVVIKAVALSAALLLAAMCQSVTWLLVACFAIGLAATMAQDVVPAAAALAPEAFRGKVIGTVMTGLLLGIILSRVISGVVTEYVGWRAMFVCAAGSIGAIGLVAWCRLPQLPAATQLGYGALLRSLIQLWRRYPALRRAALAQGLLCIGFSAFLSTLAVKLHGAPFHLGSAAAGAFGLAGAAGALAAGRAGRLADSYGPEFVTRLGSALAAGSFAAMALLPWLPVHLQLVLIALCAVGFDLGIQAAMVAHQTIVYGLEPAARSRLNTVLVVGMFGGMAAGSALGSLLFARWGWAGVTTLATTSALAALAVRLWPGEHRR